MPILPNLKAIEYNDEVMNEVTLNMFNKKRNNGFRVNIKSLNDAISGVRLGTLTILGAYTGMGKSILTLNIVNDLLESGVRVFYADLENGAEETIERLLRVRHGLTSDYFDNSDNFGDAMVKIMKLENNFHYITHEVLNELDYEHKGIKILLAIMEKRFLQDQVQVFVIDPLQALERSENKDNQLNEQGTIVKKFKEFAQKYNVAVIINHHIRKSIGTSGKFVANLDEVEAPTYRIPTLDDLKGSSKISDYATDVWAMVRTVSAPTDREKGNTLFRVLKARRKPAGDCRLWLDIKTLKFYEITGNYSEDYVRGDRVNG